LGEDGHIGALEPFQRDAVLPGGIDEFGILVAPLIQNFASSSPSWLSS
jgi:hypothetical protein